MFSVHSSSTPFLHASAILQVAWFCDCFYVWKRPFWKGIVGNEVIEDKYSIMKKAVAFRKCCSNLQSTQVSHECEILNVSIHF